MSTTLIVRAGGQVFCTHPVTGVVHVGSMEHALRTLHGRGGATPPRIPPMRLPTTVERTPPPSPAAAPVFSASSIRSHLWVG
jgi:hypothetical protein